MLTEALKFSKIVQNFSHTPSPINLISMHAPPPAVQKSPEEKEKPLLTALPSKPAVSSSMELLQNKLSQLQEAREQSRREAVTGPQTSSAPTVTTTAAPPRGPPPNLSDLKMRLERIKANKI